MTVQHLELVGSLPDFSLGHWEVVHDKERGGELHGLLSTGLQALEREDHELRTVFEWRREDDKNWYEEANRGLGYWVFETTLVYTIFKAWIPVCRARWEWPYAPGFADLAVNRPAADGDEARHWVFEAKWWMTNSKENLDAIRADEEKLRSHKSTEAGKGDRCFLVTFWYDEQAPDKWSAAKNEITKFSTGGDGLALVYAGAFPTHMHRASGRTGGYFAMAVFELI